MRSPSACTSSAWGGRVLRLSADGLISYVRRLHAERELGLPPGALTDENEEERS
jgi:hypothetical protein